MDTKGSKMQGAASYYAAKVSSEVETIQSIVLIGWF